MAGVPGELAALLPPPPLSRQLSLQPPGSPTRGQQADAGAGLARQLSLASLVPPGSTTAAPAAPAAAGEAGNKRRRTRARGGTAGRQAAAQTPPIASTAAAAAAGVGVAAAPLIPAPAPAPAAGTDNAAAEDEARKQARMAKNRATAAASRQRRLDRMAALEARVAELEAENASLRRQLGLQPGSAAPAGAATAATPLAPPGAAAPRAPLAPSAAPTAAPALAAALPPAPQPAVVAPPSGAVHTRAPLPASIEQSAALVALTRHSSLPSGAAVAAAAAATVLTPLQPAVLATDPPLGPVVLWPQQGPGQRGASAGTAAPAGAAQQQQQEAARREAAAATIRAMDPAVKAHFVAHLLRLHPDLSASLARAHARRLAASQPPAQAEAALPAQQAALHIQERQPAQAHAGQATAGVGPDAAALAALQPLQMEHPAAAGRAATPPPPAGLGTASLRAEPTGSPPDCTPEWERQLLRLPLFSFTTPDGAAAAATGSPASTRSDGALRPLSARSAAALLASPASQPLGFLATL
ncbi:hypothetical protein ABPG75_006211 [Micractinium tetrahymenae]